MEKPSKLLQWIDQHLLKILIIAYIYLIPLYPKIPLFNINYTYVHVRFEDVFVALISTFFFVQLLRKKVSINKQFLIPIGLFWIAVMISFIVGNFILEGLPPQVWKVSLLHALRRVEYMVIFFIAYAAIRTKKDFYDYLKHILIALALVCLYGLGQKILGWCAFQTMNPEFSKGYCLTLSSDARISSTFAGHYDLAAYLTLIIPIAVGAYIYFKKARYFIPFTLAIMALVLTASRASYIAYVLSTVPFLLLRKKFKLLLIVIVLTAVFTPLSGELTSRFKRTFQSTKIFIDPVTGQAVVPQDPRQLPPGSIDTIQQVPIASNAPKIIDPKADKQAKEQIRQQVIAAAQKKGLFLDEQQINAEVEKAFNKYIPVQRYLPDISQSVRYKVSWPRAIQAFIFNPLTGKGPFSLGEATDGDYFRWLGEFGLIGTGLFLYIFFVIGQYILKNVKHQPYDEQDVYYAFLFGIIGLLINATYIDVFEASKVAYHVWLFAGLCIGALTLGKKPEKTIQSKTSINNSLQQTL